MNIQTYKLLNRLSTIIILLIMSGVQLFSQGAELEILGRRKMWFQVFTDGIEQNRVPVNRLLIQNLQPGHTDVTILFADTLIKTVSDSLFLEPGTRMVYRIVKAQKSPLPEPSNAVRKFKKLFSADETTTTYKPDVYKLMFLERTALPEQAYTAIKDTTQPQADSLPAIRPQSAFHFTRETPLPPRLSDTAKTETLKTSDQGAVSEQDSLVSGKELVPPDILTEQLHYQVLTSLSGLRFEEDRIQYLNRTLKDVSLTSKQLCDILGKFDFERSKLQISKQYFSRLTDKENVSLLYDAFEFNTTAEELKQWLHEQSR